VFPAVGSAVTAVAPATTALAPTALLPPLAAIPAMIPAIPAPAVAMAQAPPPHLRPQAPPDPVHSGEDFLMEMLAGMDHHMQQVRDTQQGLVATVELACRKALDQSFGRLVLVGSAALRVETPGSDVDVVCFTRRDRSEAVGLPVNVLRRVHWVLKDIIKQYSDYSSASFSMELIDDARVPVLRVIWSSPVRPALSVAVDVSVDQSRPVDHVHWFQRVGAAPCPKSPPPMVAPLVTLTLRCVKWWLKQRQIPRTKEGGLPTVAWLLMAVHVCSLPETHEQALQGCQRAMAALLASLSSFFRHYAALGCLDGILQFAADGSSSEFRRRSRADRPKGDRASDSWAEFAVLDPTREGSESLNLAPPLPPATQLLLAHELRRAGQRLERIPTRCEASAGESRRILGEVFEPLPEGTNAMPSFMGCAVGVLLLWGENLKGGGGRTIECGMVEHIVPRPGWAAPFLHRSDDRSELHVRLCDVDERTGRCHTRRKIPVVVLCPCHFICRVHLEKEGRTVRLDAEGLERLKAMRCHLQTLDTQQQRHREEAPAKALVDSAPTAPALAPPGPSLGSIPSPTRSCFTQA